MKELDFSKNSFMNKQAVYEACLFAGTVSDPEIIGLLAECNSLDCVVDVLDTITGVENEGILFQ